MNILVPANDAHIANKYISLGANELYFGFYDEKWIESFGKYSDINRMSGFGKRANKYSFNELIELITHIKQRNCRVFITMNANVYSDAQLEFIRQNYLPKCRNAGVDGVIVSDINLAKLVLSFGIDVVASTMCAIYNSDIAKYFYDIGIKRMIIPRDLNLNEIESIIKCVPKVSFEAFFMRDGCVFSDCYCLGMHRPECGSTCSYIKNSEKMIVSIYKGFEAQNAIEMNDYFYNKEFHFEACGMCALYRLNKIGIKSLKIVGRADDYESVCHDIDVTRRNIEIMNNSISEEDYLNKMIFPRKTTITCRMGMSCYYPEVRYGIDK